ncbi:hypothetical protein HZA45_02145 [Candidatus Peregrinibacteria bacterium]|nr:hypothetical protein [Candidatus Peregrinibacteria bacterium]
MEPRIRLMIEKKLKQYLSSDNPMRFAVPVVHLPPATHRFRVGDYRVMFFREESIFCIICVERRDKVYRMP